MIIAAEQPAAELSATQQQMVQGSQGGGSERSNLFKYDKRSYNLTWVPNHGQQKLRLPKTPKNAKS